MRGKLKQAHRWLANQRAERVLVKVYENIQSFQLNFLKYTGFIPSSRIPESKLYVGFPGIPNELYGIPARVGPLVAKLFAIIHGKYHQYVVTPTG